MFTNLAAASNSLAWSDTIVPSVGRRFYRLIEIANPGLPFTNTLLAVDGVAVQLINPGFDSSELAASAGAVRSSGASFRRDQP